MTRALAALAALVAACALPGCAAAPRADRLPAPAPAPAAFVPPQLAGMQYLYGSGEAAAISRQAWAALVDHVAGRIGGKDRSGVVLAADATLAAPRFVPCGPKPPAVVFDVDETVLLNLGVEAEDLRRTIAEGQARPFDSARWDRWEKTGAAAVAPAPGARAALEALRAMGIAVVFNSNRSAANAAATEAALDGAGLGPARHGETLYLMGDDATGSRKDLRRQAIAARFCVVAMGGDQLGDFSDLFRIPNLAERRAATGLPGIAPLWGHGWFLLPNPVYGSALAGGIEDIFPADKRWRDPAAAQEGER